MLDIFKMRMDRINDYIKEIRIIAGERTDWWKDSKIQERVMYIRNLSYVGNKLIGKNG